MEPFKNIYNKKSITQLSKEIHLVDPDFDQENFFKIATKNLSKLEMKQRVDQIAYALSKSLVNHPHQTLIKILAPYKYHQNQKWQAETPGIYGFMVWPLTRYIELYERDNLKKSMKALYEMTKRFSSEFAIRSFIQQYDQEAYHYLEEWVNDKNYHVRRLVSEGTRPRLPWGKKVENINKNLERNILLLDQLVQDETLYVRKSVANHMNDISYFNQDLFFKTLKRWKKHKSKEVDWIIRHASRSLLKRGDPMALKLHGYKTHFKLKTKLNLSKKVIAEGDRFELTLKIKNQSKVSLKALIEYVIDYPKKNGQYSSKVFRLKDTIIKNHLEMTKSIHFKKVTTRTHYPGLHKVRIQINGQILQEAEFILNG
jgi:3-methyladenine DNA glycosylase AlkC